jgi:hypothetical protein
LKVAGFGEGARDERLHLYLVCVAVEDDGKADKCMLRGSARTRSALAADLGLAVLLAAEAGYGDRSHVNRECLRLTAVSSRRLKTGCFALGGARTERAQLQAELMLTGR